MMSHGVGDHGVALHVAQDPFADDRMLFHLPALVKRQCTWFLEEARWQTDLANVMDQSRDVRHLLILRRQPEPTCDVARIDRDGRRVASGVSIPGIESRY